MSIDISTRAGAACKRCGNGACGTHPLSSGSMTPARDWPRTCAVRCAGPARGARNGCCFRSNARRSNCCSIARCAASASLPSTGMACPTNCAKQMRNGPCGGVRADGSVRGQSGHALRLGRSDRRAEADRPAAEQDFPRADRSPPLEPLVMAAGDRWHACAADRRARARCAGAGDLRLRTGVQVGAFRRHRRGRPARLQPIPVC